MGVKGIRRSGQTYQCSLLSTAAVESEGWTLYVLRSGDYGGYPPEIERAEWEYSRRVRERGMEGGRGEGGMEGERE